MTALKWHSVLSESCALVNPFMFQGRNVLGLHPLRFQLPNQLVPATQRDQTQEIKETLQTVAVIFIKSQLQHLWL